MMMLFWSIRCFILLQAVKTVFEQKKNGQSLLLDFLVCIVIGGPLFAWTDTLRIDPCVVPTIVFLTILITALYKTDLLKTFNLAALIAVGIGAVEYMILTVISTYWIGYMSFIDFMQLYEISLLVSCAIDFLLCVGIYAMSLKAKDSMRSLLNTQRSLTVFTIVLGVSYLYLEDITVRLYDYLIPEVWMLFFAILVIGILMFYYVQISNRQKVALQAIKNQNALQHEKSEDLAEVYDHYAELQHYFIHQLNTLESMIKEKKIDEAVNFIHETSDHAYSMALMKYTGLKTVDLVFILAMKRMKEYGIPFDYEIDKLEVPDLEEDLSVISSNVIKSAVRGTLSTKKPSVITFRLRRQHQFVVGYCSYYAKIVNTDPYPVIDDDLNTLQMKSIRLICDRQDGNFSASESNGFVQLEFYVPIRSKD